MIAGIADTHAALWYLLGDPRLSASARWFIDDIASAGHDVAVSSITLAEIVYLVEKRRLPESAYRRLRSALADPDYVIEEVPLTSDVVDAMRHVPRADVPDLPDRIVAATGVHFGVPIISRDGRIRAANLKTVW